MKMPIAIAAALSLAIAARAEPPARQPAMAQPAASVPQPYVPGLGEMMGAIQLRHAKLWYAGKVRNWELADYELGEIKEAFVDAATYQPVFKGRPVAEMLQPITNDAIVSVEKAIEAKNAAQFSKAFDHLSNACNTCHKSAGYGFISIQRPTTEPLTNQRFASGKP